jgi:hypothetical protein
MSRAIQAKNKNIAQTPHREKEINEVNEPFHQSSLRESSHQKDQKLHSRQ